MVTADDRIASVLADLVRSGHETGVQVAAYLDGSLIFDAWAGLADPASGPVS